MNHLSVDVAVIGAGSAGLTAYKAARSHHGKRVVLIEGGPYGTTCARVGCMPSKLLIAAAEAAHGMAMAPAFGVHPGTVRIDGRAVMARVRSERDRFVGYVVAGVDRIDPGDLLRGSARFLDAARLQVGEHTILQARSVVVATGSSPYIPPDLAAAGERLVVNDDVFAWEDLPESVAVVGTGIIGLEIGQALQRLGVRVALFGRGGNVAQLSDPAVRDVAIGAFRQELDLRLNAELLGVQREGAQVRIRSRGADGSERSETFSFLLAAAGRVPNLQTLCLERTGITLDTRGLPLFDPQTMQCGVSPVFIAGDADNDKPLLHEAIDQGRIAGDNAGRYPDVHAGLRRTPLAIVFTDPQLASVGQGWRSLRPGSFAVGAVSFDNQGRSRVMLQNRGLLRLYAEHGSGRLLGAEMAAPRAEHLAHLLAWACQSGMTIAQMLQLPFYHPVIEEGLRSALHDAQDKLLKGEPEIEHCTDCTPGM